MSPRGASVDRASPVGSRLSPAKSQTAKSQVTYLTRPFRDSSRISQSLWGSTRYEKGLVWWKDRSFQVSRMMRSNSGHKSHPTDKPLPSGYVVRIGPLGPP